MKLLVLGTGMIVNDFLNGVHELELDKVYIWGRTYEKANYLKEKYKLNKVFDSLDCALKSDADVVYIGLPNNLHYEFAEKSILAGKHVICEKPFMINSKQVEDISILAKHHNKMIFEAALAFYFPTYYAMKEDIQTLGEIHCCQLNFSQYSSRYDRFLKGDIAPSFDIKHCGGSLMDLNVYNINVLVGLFGMPYSVSYNAVMKNNIDVSGLAILKYDNFVASCMASKSTAADRCVIIQGEKGTLHLPSSMSRAYKYVIKYNNGYSLSRNFEDKHHRMYHEFKFFIDKINNNDFLACEKYMEISKKTAKVLDLCRKDSNIIFTEN